MVGRVSGTLLARIKVDEQHCFRWSAVRSSRSSFHPKYTAMAWWKHRALSFVEQEGVKPMLTDRGAERREVEGAAQPWGWWRLKVGYALRSSKEQESFLGLARAVMRTCTSSIERIRAEQRTAHLPLESQWAHDKSIEDQLWAKADVIRPNARARSTMPRPSAWTHTVLDTQELQPKPPMRWRGITRKALSWIHSRQCAARHAQCKPVR